MSNPTPGGQSPRGVTPPPYGQPGWDAGQPQLSWSPQVDPGPAAPERRGKALWYVAAGLVVVLAAGATLWLTVFKNRDQPAAAASQQDVAHSYIDAARAHDVEAIKKVSCKEDLDKIAKNPADVVLPATVTIASYKITGQHDVDGGAEATGGATVIDGSITFNDGKQTMTDPIDLAVIKEGGAFKACTSVAIRIDK